MHDPLREAQPTPSGGCTPEPGSGSRQAKYRTGGDARARGETQAPLDWRVQRRSGRFPEAGRPGTWPRDRQALKGPKPYERRPFPRRSIVPMHEKRRRQKGPAMRAELLDMRASGHGDYYVMRGPKTR